MFERYDEGARRTLFFARYEATQFGAAAIETEHLLLGVMRDTRDAGPLLARHGVSPESVREEIARAASRGATPARDEIPFSEETKHALFCAASEATRARSRRIGAEHLLLALLCEEGSLAASVLAGRGLTAEGLRREILEDDTRLLGADAGPAGDTPARAGAGAHDDEGPALFARLTDAARDVLFLASEESGRLGGRAIGAEHLLLGLLRHGKGLSPLLVRDGLSLERVRESLTAASGGHGDPVPARADLPFTDECRNALRIAAREATRLRQKHIATHHLLLGVLDEQAVIAEQALRNHGVDVARLRNEVQGILDGMDRARRPIFPPSYQVHIFPTRLEERGTTGHSAPDYWSHRGFGLRATIAEVFGVDEARIDWQSDLNAAERHDIEVHLPEFEGQDEIFRLVQHSIQREFRLTIVREHRLENVYVLTASSNPAPRPVPLGAGGFFTMSLGSSEDVGPGLSPPRDLSINGQIGIGHLCAALGKAIGRPFIDHTGLEGEYHVDVRDAGETLDDFFRALRDRAALVATPDRRHVTMLVVRKAET